MIIQLDEARLKLVSLRDDAKELGISMRIDELQASVAELEEKIRALLDRLDLEEEMELEEDFDLREFEEDTL